MELPWEISLVCCFFCGTFCGQNRTSRHSPRQSVRNLNKDHLDLRHLHTEVSALSTQRASAHHLASVQLRQKGYTLREAVQLLLPLRVCDDNFVNVDAAIAKMVLCAQDLEVWAKREEDLAAKWQFRAVASRLRLLQLADDKD